MSPYPKCPICKHPHRSGDNHVWGEHIEPVAQPVEPLTFNQVVAGSNPAGPTTTDDISRDHLGRGVAASATDPVTVGSIKSDDEGAARLGEIPNASVELSQPPQSIFDRNAYQARYLREIWRPAKKLGLTPAEYKAKFPTEGEKS